MSLSMTPQSELDSINVILFSIGQSPVNTLESTGIKDVEIARFVLHDVNRQVQTKGWTFNTDYALSLSPNENNRILVPANALSIDPVSPGDDFVQRYDVAHEAMSMYDMKRQTFERTTALKVDIVWFLPFESIPQAARNYVALKAARVFQAGAVASDILFRFEQHHEQEALVTLMREHALVGDRNILSGSPDFTTAIFHRRFRPRF